MSDIRQKIAALLLCATLACANDDAPAPAPAPATRDPQPAPAENPAPATATATANILFLGTSLTAGYGVGSDNAFPALIQDKLDSAQLDFRVVNAGLSGETSAGGLRRLEWSLQQPVHVLVLELGANDGLRGLPVEQLGANLDSIIVRTRRAYPDADVVIAGMEAPPNLGASYTSAFRATFARLAQKHDAVLIPFVLKGVAAQADLNQQDGIHPAARGHERIAETVWQALLPVLTERIRTKKAPAATE
ncbi:MAG: arylesterase [Gemmatimonadota bacterium]